MASIRKTPREKALAEVADYTATLARWEAEQATAQAELRSLEERIGEEVLADESAASRLAKTMQELRDRAEIATRTAEAVRPKLLAAQRAALIAEADEVATDVAKARGKLEAHEARTAELVAMLREHDGITYAPLVDDRPLSETGPRVVETCKRDLLADDLLLVELRELILREVAAGRDPAPQLSKKASIVDGKIAGVAPHELYSPSVWGPRAVLPAAAYLREVAGVEDTIRRLDAEMETLPGRISNMEAQQEGNKNRIAGIPAARKRLESLPGRREQAVAELDALTGSSD